MKQLLRLGLLVFSLLAAPLPVRAEPPAAPGGGPAPGEWENVSGGMMVPPGESIPASRLVGAAYGFIWVMVAGFVASVWWRQRALDRELGELRRRIDAASSGGSG